VGEYHGGLGARRHTLSLVLGKGVVEWIASRTGEFNCFGTDVGIGWVKHGKIVAGVAYANWNGVNVECHIASDGSRRWLTRQYLWTIFHYPFCQLGVKRITVCVGEGNADSTRFVKHLGFKLEAKLKDAHPTGDLQIFRMFANECRFLQVKHEQKLAA
jgi:RimJ/RimL family protein N-acetyltransferase